MFTILHLLGVAIGAGSAYMSDVLFLWSTRDGKISTNESQFMYLAGRMVWAGLFLLVVSGIGLVMESPEYFLSSSKFLAKMTIVAVLTINGIVFHLYRMPYLKEHTGERLTSAAFSKRGPLLLVSGAISFISWTSALILGALRGLPYSYGQIVSVYVGIVLVTVCVALFSKRLILAR